MAIARAASSGVWAKAGAIALVGLFVAISGLLGNADGTGTADKVSGATLPAMAIRNQIMTDEHLSLDKGCGS